MSNMPDLFSIKGETLKATADTIRQYLQPSKYQFIPEILENSSKIVENSVNIYYREYIDMETVNYTNTNNSLNDRFVAYGYVENDRKQIVPVLYKTDTKSFPDEVDYKDVFFYEGTAEIYGVTYDKWRKIDQELRWDSEKKYYFYTNIVVQYIYERIYPEEFPRKIESVFSDGYSSGYHDGETYGFEEGYTKGESAGYLEGYEKGKAEGRTEGKTDISTLPNFQGVATENAGEYYYDLLSRNSIWISTALIPFDGEIGTAYLIKAAMKCGTCDRAGVGFAYEDGTLVLGNRESDKNNYVISSVGSQPNKKLTHIGLSYGNNGSCYIKDFTIEAVMKE